MAEIHELIGVDLPVVLAAGAGAVSSVIIVKDQAPARAAFGVFVGFCVGIFFTPMLDSNRFWDLGNNMTMPIAFILGLVGKTIAGKFVQWMQALDMGPIFDRLLRRNGGDPPKPTNGVKP